MKDLFKISPGFQYSVNLKYDIDNPDKISSYIPTEKSILFLDELISSLDAASNDRARLLIGPYGTGKSHFIAFVGALLRGNLPKESFETVLEKIIASGQEKLVNKINSEILGNKKFLTVLINGNGENLEQTFLYGLYLSIKEAGIKEVLPNTVFSEIEKTLDVWEKKFHETHNRFKVLINDKYNLSYDEYIVLLKKYDIRSYNIFSKLYPTLAAGANFNPFVTNDIPGLYMDVSNKIKSHEYEGIVLIFDEFNKCLENAATSKESLNLKVLQDFAELCNRSGELQLHMILISHQHISQYANKLSKDMVNEWLKVEGRFKTIELTQKSSKTYNLISKVILKEKKIWDSFKKNHIDSFNKLKENSYTYALFRDLPEEQQLNEWILEGCFPLHPATTYCLPRISNKIAQNERTIFTFLASNGFHSLGEFIENYNDLERFKLLTIEILFDYFSGLMKKQSYQEQTYIAWKKATQAMQKIKEDNILANKIIKALAVITAIDEEKSLPPTVEFLKYSLWRYEELQDKFEEALNLLLKYKAIYVRKSDGHIRFFEGSDLDIDAEIEKVRGTHRYKSHFNVAKILNEYFLPYPIIGNRYNDKYDMTRFFMPKYYTYKQVDKGIFWDEECEDSGDGILALVIVENQEELNNFSNLVERINHGQVLFVCAKEPLDLKKLLFTFKALSLLKMDKKFIEQDPLVDVELEVYLDDYLDNIETDLGQLIEPRLNKADYFYRGKITERITSRAALSRKISSICEDVFDKTPIVNNELINKTNLSTTLLNARKKVIDGLLQKNIKKNLGIKGHGPDMSIFRSMFASTGIYEEKNDVIKIKQANKENFNAVLNIINNWIDNSAEAKNFSQIYNQLLKPPYGIRLGVIPIFLAISLREHQNHSIIKDSRGIEVPLSADTIESIAKRPDNYTIQIENIDKAKADYITAIANEFSKFISFGDSALVNKLYPVASGIKSWFVSLPKFARETSKLNSETLIFRKAIKLPSLDSQELLFKKLPKAITDDEVFNAKNLYIYIKKIASYKKELDGFVDKVKGELKDHISETYAIAAASDDNILSILRNWHDDLSADTKNHLFAGNVNAFLETVQNFDGYDDNKFIDNLARNITGLRIEDWSDDVYESFFLSIKSIKNIVEKLEKGFKENNCSNESLIKIIIPSSNGAKEEITFEDVEITSLGETLLNNIEASIESYADAIPVDEKRQILIRLLNKLG